jgi:hypothetical protein
MDLTKIYYDSNGMPGNILQIIKREPEWAANRIQAGEKALQQADPSDGRPPLILMLEEA